MIVGQNPAAMQCILASLETIVYDSKKEKEKKLMVTAVESLFPFTTIIFLFFFCTAHACHHVAG
jgi:hypothetical protein